MAVLAEHFADINDRVDADAVVVATHTGETTKHFLLVDEDNMASNSATVAASQQSVKAYVDAQTSGWNKSKSWISTSVVIMGILLMLKEGGSLGIDTIGN